MTHEQIAEKLFEAYKNSTLTENLAEEDSVKTSEEAYKIQQMFFEKRIKLGEKISGAKAGATSKAAMKVMNLTEPFFAPLTDKDFFTGDLSFLKCPGMQLVELEIAFRAINDISEDADAEEIIKNTEIAMAVEVPTRRTKNPEKINDLIADCGCGGNVYYVNNFIPTPGFEALASYRGRVYLDGKVVAQGASDGVLDNPVNAMMYANKMMNKLYTPIKKGMVIISGSLTPPLQAVKGEYKFEIDNLGTAEFKITE